MGKLHALRKEIEQYPERWIRNPCWYRTDYTGMRYAYGARVSGRSWRRAWNPGGLSYRRFVRHVLRELGYKVN